MRPLIAAVFGAHLAQPIGGEFAFNHALLQQMSAWEATDSVRLHGIDVWLTANALRAGLRVAEVPLGRKEYSWNYVKWLSRTQQLLDALFHVMTWLDKPRPVARTAAAHRQVVDEAAPRGSPPQYTPALRACLSRYVARHREDLCRLFPSARNLQCAPWGMRVPAETWPELLADAVEGLAAGEFLRSRDHLMALLVSRTATFWEEVQDLDAHRIDSVLARQVRDTAAAVRRRNIAFRGSFPASFGSGLWEGL
ncbi:hypothetical protein [Streptomyces sirii]|uniref:hypothetical protein n=1 Tax=Streptomyces sirii TaxID=3127701 RepID=UPI003D3679D5